MDEPPPRPLPQRGGDDGDPRGESADNASQNKTPSDTKELQSGDDARGGLADEKDAGSSPISSVIPSGPGDPTGGDSAIGAAGGAKGDPIGGDSSSVHDVNAVGSTVVVKRGRGRPQKHPLSSDKPKAAGAAIKKPLSPPPPRVIGSRTSSKKTTVARKSSLASEKEEREGKQQGDQANNGKDNEEKIADKGEGKEQGTGREDKGTKEKNDEADERAEEIPERDRYDKNDGKDRSRNVENTERNGKTKEPQIVEIRRKGEGEEGNSSAVSVGLLSVAVRETDRKSGADSSITTTTMSITTTAIEGTSERASGAQSANDSRGAGEGDSRVKRGRGRPKRGSGAAKAETAAGKGTAVVSRGRGWPRKVSSIPTATPSAASDDQQGKRKRKNSKSDDATDDEEGDAGGPSEEPRGRNGRGVVTASKSRRLAAENSERDSDDRGGKKRGRGRPRLAAAASGAKRPRIGGSKNGTKQSQKDDEVVDDDGGDQEGEGKSIGVSVDMEEEDEEGEGEGSGDSDDHEEFQPDDDSEEDEIAERRNTRVKGSGTGKRKRRARTEIPNAREKERPNKTITESSDDDGDAKGKTSRGDNKAKTKAKAKAKTKVEAKNADQKRGTKKRTSKKVRQVKDPAVKKPTKMPFKKWVCRRCGTSFKGEGGALYHIYKRVCDKTLERLYRDGKYWNGQEAVDIPPDGQDKPVGALSPDFPTMDLLGLSARRLKSVTNKLEARGEEAFKCTTCSKSFGSKAGWRYHTQMAVCTTAKTGTVPTHDTQQQYQQEGRYKKPRRAAAAKAASKLTAAALEARAEGSNLMAAGEGSIGDDVEAEDPLFDPTLSDDSGDYVEIEGREGGRGRKGGGRSRPWFSGRGRSGCGKVGRASGTTTGAVGSREGGVGSRGGGGGGGGGEVLRVRAKTQRAMAETATAKAVFAVEERARLAQDLEGDRAEPPIVTPKRSWRHVPVFKRWAWGNNTTTTTGSSSGKTAAVGGATSKEQEVEEGLEIPSWEVTTVSAWARKTRGGGGDAAGKLLPRPLEVEVVEEDTWTSGGKFPADKAAGTEVPRRRLRVPTFQSAVAAFSSRGGSNTDGPEVVFNVGASVFGVDTLVLPRPTAAAGLTGGRGGRSSGAGASVNGEGKSKMSSDHVDGDDEDDGVGVGVGGLDATAEASAGRGEVYVAVATGPLRETDKPIDEEDCFKHVLEDSSPLPLLGERMSGPGLLQIWRAKNTSFHPRSQPDPFSVNDDKAAPPADAPTKDRQQQEEKNGVFELAYGIAHDGGGVMKCKWAPEEFDGEVEEACMRRGRGAGGERGGGALGLLAGVFGDGSLRVFVCPTPEAVQKAASAEAGGNGISNNIGKGSGNGIGSAPTGETALVLKTKAVLHATLKRTELTCLDWSPHDPTLLLAGAADGSVCIWKITGTNGEAAEGRVSGFVRHDNGDDDDRGTRRNYPVPFKQFACASIGLYEPVQSVIRAVAWCPESPELFAATGAGHLLSVWDTSEFFEPLCCYPLRALRCEGANVVWGPARTGIWISGTTRPFLFFLDFYEGGMREVVYRMSNVNRRPDGLAAEILAGAEEDTCPYEDAVLGLHVVRADTRPAPGSLPKHTHLAAWTAPSGQIRVTSASCRECDPSDHHHLAAAFVNRFGKRSKRSQHLELEENRVMHRLEYVLPDSGRTAGAHATGIARGGGGDDEPRAAFVRVFAGGKSEGTRTVKWREASVPLSGILNVSHMVHIPPTSPPSAPDTGTSNVRRGKGACVLISGGHAGLVRCSAIPHRPPQKQIRQAVTGRPRISKRSGQPSAARKPSTAGQPVAGKPLSVTAVSVDTSGRIVPAAGLTEETETSDGLSLPPPPPVGGNKQPRTVAPALVPTFTAVVNTTKPSGYLADKNRSVAGTAMIPSLATTTTAAAAVDNPLAASRSSTAGRSSGSQDVARSAAGGAARGNVVKTPLVRPPRLPRADREALLKRSREHVSSSGSSNSSTKRARSAAVTKPHFGGNGGAATAAAARLAGGEAGEGVAGSTSLRSSEKTTDVTCNAPVAISIGTGRGKSDAVNEANSRVPGLELRGGSIAASQGGGGRDNGVLEGQGGDGGGEAPALVVPAWAVVPQGFGDAGASGEDGATQKRRAFSI